MCGSMVDIQSPTAEIRQGKKKKKPQDENIYGLPYYVGQAIKQVILTWWQVGRSWGTGLALNACSLCEQILLKWQRQVAVWAQRTSSHLTLITNVTIIPASTSRTRSPTISEAHHLLYLEQRDHFPDSTNSSTFPGAMGMGMMTANTGHQRSGTRDHNTDFKTTHECHFLHSGKLRT